MKRKDSNCVGIISDQGETATASNLSEYTTHNSLLYFPKNCKLGVIKGGFPFPLYA